MSRLRRVALKVRHRYLVPLVSWLPERILKAANRYWPKDYSDGIGWTFWLDASYYAWCRRDRMGTRS